MITFNNRTENHIKITVHDSILILEPHQSYTYQDNIREFIVESHTEKGNRILDYILIATVGFFCMIFDALDSIYSSFKNYLSLPVRVIAEDCKSDTVFEINESRDKIFSYTIHADCPVKTELVISDSYIDEQYACFKKECIAAFFIPALIVVVFCTIFVLSKNIVACIVTVFILAMVAYIIISRRRKNLKYIHSIKTK